MVRIILFTLGLYLLYKLVTDFIFPVVRTTNNIRRQFDELKQHAAQSNGYQKQTPDYNNNNTPSPRKQPHTKPYGTADEYIEFEEVK